MAELAGTIIGIVSVGTKVALVLSQLAAGMGSAGKEARSIASEIRGLCAVLKTLHQALSKVSTSPYFEHCLELTNDMTDASREMYFDILKITKNLQDMARTQEGRFKLRSRFYWVAFQKPKITALRAALEAYKSNLSLMLGTLNIAEKATRPMSTIISLEDVAENEQDSSLLNGLRLDHEAALIDLQEVGGSLSNDDDSNEPNVELNASNANDSSIVIATEGADAIINDHFLTNLQHEVDSLRSSRTSFHSLNSMSDAASRHSKRLSQMLIQEENRISLRQSQILSESRLSQVNGHRDIRAPVVLPDAEGPDLKTPTAEGFPHKNHNVDTNTVRTFYKDQTADSYFFSCFDLLGFSADQTCWEVQISLFQKHGLRYPSSSWSLGEYNAKLFVLRGHVLWQLRWDESPIPVVKRFTRRGECCGIIFHKTSVDLTPYATSDRNASYLDRNLAGSREILQSLTYNEPKSPLSATTPSPTTPTAEIFKRFRVSDNDPCYKVLPIALQKYEVNEDWRDFDLYLVYENTERCLGRNDKPLRLLKQLSKEGRKPVFMLRRRHKSPMKGFEDSAGNGSASPVALPGGVI
ncbi:MAG: hypothetical protein M1820_009877 [Bogoriella megaspora]|nr:MAG: hypothetical protein M1820_009877 [Bogoriella megaspora]